MKKMNNKGFSLIELIIVIAIMAVLVAIIAPNLTKYLGRSKTETDKKNLDEIKKQIKNVISEAAIDGVTVVPSGTSADYFITGQNVSTTNGDATFANMLQNVFDADTVTKSKVTPSKTSIKATVTGSESEGFTVTAVFS
jgi:type IV pilus assembly protein PilA